MCDGRVCESPDPHLIHGLGRTAIGVRGGGAGIVAGEVLEDLGRLCGRAGGARTLISQRRTAAGEVVAVEVSGGILSDVNQTLISVHPVLGVVWMEGGETEVSLTGVRGDDISNRPLGLVEA